MAISLETLRLPASLRPSRSTITRSEVRIIPLLMEVGVTRTRLRSRRTERLPSVPATNPHPCSIPPSWIISFRYWRWLAIFKNTPSLSLAAYGTEGNLWKQRMIRSFNGNETFRVAACRTLPVPGVGNSYNQQRAGLRLQLSLAGGAEIGDQHEIGRAHV